MDDARRHQFHDEDAKSQTAALDAAGDDRAFGAYLVSKHTVALYAVKPLKPAPLEYPSIDLGAIPGDGPEPKHPFEPFSYTERS